MAIYKTKQRENIFLILSENFDRQMTISEIKQIIDKKNLHIGLTTIYRTLNDLEEKNLLLKNIKDNGEAEFQMIKDNCKNHFHIKCANCGKLKHLECDEMNSVANHIEQKHQFHINPMSTTIVGLCNDCNTKKKENN